VKQIHQRARDVVKIGDKLFNDKSSLNSLWQEIALNFFPERADFTSKRDDGEEFADHLFSSYPVIARRELGNLLAANMRPRDRKWFSVHVGDEETDEDEEARAFMERLTEIQWRAMYDRPAMFVRATKETDHDFITFGNGVIYYGININGDGLLFRNYHLRDCAWSENAEGKIDVLHRNWSPSARQLKTHFPKTISKDVVKACEKTPEQTFKCRHVVLPSRLYDYKTKGGKSFPYVSLYVECESETILEEVGLNYFPYVCPRWQTVSGSAYGVSMATGILLPDGRTMQVVLRTLREAGESYVNPPMIAVSDAIRGDIALYPGGVTTADIEYDERLGEVLRPITKDRGGFPIGENIAAALREDIRHGFFLDKIQLPEVSKTMTAFEVRRRLEEHMRSSAPIFEPIVEDYSDPLCDGVFKLLMDNGAFPMGEMPEILMDEEIKFKFRSPLTDLADQADAEVYIEARDRILGPALQVDPAQMENIDFTRATRDALKSSGFKAKWMKPIEAVEAARQAANEQAEAEAMMNEVGQVGAIAEQGGKGAEAIMKAMAPPQAKPSAPAKPAPRAAAR
jgi:hypothetical protein